MFQFVRINLGLLILKPTSQFVWRPPVRFSFPLYYLSSSTKSGLGISPDIFDILVNKHNFPPELASRVALESTHLKPENTDSVLSFFKEHGFSNPQLERMVKYSTRFLLANTERNIRPKFKIFQEMGFSPNDIARVISHSPTILHLSVENNIIPSLTLLKRLLGSNSEVVSVIRRSWMLTGNLENTVLPNVEFFKSCGIPMVRIRTILSAHPYCFTMKTEALRKCADKAREMGLDETSKNFIYAVTTIGKVRNETWELKLQAFRDLGFSDTDILIMFRKAPSVFSSSVEKIKKIKEILLGTGKFDICNIVNYPFSLAFSVEKRYKPRLKILKFLESRDLIEAWPELRTVCVLSDDQFFERFVQPHSNEVGNIYLTKSSARGKKEVKP